MFMEIPKKMKATILYGPDDLRIEEVDVPDVGPHEVLIKVEVDALCPTGIHAVHLGKQWGPPGVKIIGMAGHEFSGTVVKVGDAVDNVKVGDRVVADTIIRCGRCYYCKIGKSNLCENKRNLGYLSWAEYIKTVDYQTYKIPDDLTFEEAAFTEPLACVLNGFEMLNAKPGKVAVVIGSGPMGLLHMQMLKYAGGVQVIITDLIEDRLKKAKELGADEVINITKEDPEEKVKELTNGKGADYVVVTVGNTKVQESAMKIVAPLGKVLLYAGVHVHGEPQMVINPNLIHYKEVQLMGSYDKTSEQFQRAINIIAQRIIKVMPLVSHKLPFSKLHEAIEIADKRKGLKVLVYPSKWE